MMLMPFWTDMYSKEIVFPGVKFILQSDNLEAFNKQVNHVAQFYTPYEILKSTNQSIEVYYIENQKLYNDILEECKYKKYVLHQSFTNQIHREYQLDENNHCYIIDNKDYICIKSDNNHYKIISDGRESAIKWPFRIIREILVRKKEENKSLFMHGTAVTIDNKGILILGNSGSGKTTLATKMLELEEKIGFLSNDRVFINYFDVAKMDYFPIPVVYAMCTVKNNSNLDKYFKETRILEKRANKEYEASKNIDKVDVPLTDMPKIFKNVSMETTSEIGLIIFSNLNYINDTQLNSRYLTQKECEIKLNQTCFTPFDWESLRLEWIYKRKFPLPELIENKINIIEQIAKNVPTIELDYGVNVNKKQLIKIITE